MWIQSGHDASPSVGTVGSLLLFVLFSICLSSSSLCLVQETPGKPSKSSSDESADPWSRKVTFKVNRTSSGMKNDGFPFSAMRWSVSDGGVVDGYFVDFKTPDQARKELQSWTVKAVNTVCKTAEIDGQGHRIGERILATFPGESSDKNLVRLIWNVGRKFRIVSADSLDHVLEWEKQALADPIHEGAEDEQKHFP